MLRNFMQDHITPGKPAEPDPEAGAPTLADPFVSVADLHAESVLEAEPKDPKVLGDGGPFVRCRTCGRDIPARPARIPADASCPECGALPFEYDVSQT